MRKSIFLILLTFFLYTPLIAITPQKTESILITKSIEKKLIGPSIRYFEDKTRKHTLYSIKKIPEKKWKTSNKNSMNFGFTSSIYWVTFSIKNKTKQQINWFLEIAY